MEDFGEKRFSFPLVTKNSSVVIGTEIKEEIMQRFSIDMASVFPFLLLHFPHP
jgi:hypothetical protein